MLCCLIPFSKYQSCRISCCLEVKCAYTWISSTSIFLFACVQPSASNSRVTRTFFRFPSRVLVFGSRLFLEIFSLIHIKYSDFGKFALEPLYKNSFFFFCTKKEPFLIKISQTSAFAHSHIALAHRLSSSRGAARSLYMISTPWSYFFCLPLA